MGKQALHFDWIEYIVFVLMLVVSTVIGGYFGFLKKIGQRSIVEYLYGGRDMPLLPISCSLICTFVSGIVMLGIPNEIYTYGTQYLMVIVAFTFACLISGFLTVPVLYNLKLDNLYEYLEMRFNSTVRRVVSFVYLLFRMTYTSIVVYVPALALNQVSGIHIHTTTITLSLVCIFYTTAGGLRAVCWTDILQGLIMLCAVLLIAVIGTSRVGGLYSVIEAAQQGDRLELFDMNLDPRRRISFWSVISGLTFLVLAEITSNPSYYQRFTALPTLKKVRWSLFYWTLGTYFFIASSGYHGLLAYKTYKGCDPKASGDISRSDQLLPYFIVDVLGDVKGLPGIFVAGIFSAALSTISSTINIISGTVYMDFVQPMIGTTSEKRARVYIKAIGVIFGLLSIAFVLVVEKLGSVIELANIVTGSFSGCTLGIFILGLFFPQANCAGASIGGLLGFGLVVWLFIGNHFALKSGQIVYQTKPLSVGECKSSNLTITNSYPTPGISEDVFPLYQLNMFSFSVLSTVSVVIIGVLASYITGTNKPGTVKKELLSPLVHRFLPPENQVDPKELALLAANVAMLNDT